ncbi:MAG: hypothetical protein HUU54_06575 [Ignavibacteriaceae bacterium]|nr:hypothetical protein [Ignavibacteriaceae bacterium]
METIETIFWLIMGIMTAMGLAGMLLTLIPYLKDLKLSPEERAKRLEEELSKSLNAANNINGRLTPQLVCPHCGIKGNVRVKEIRKKTGISGAKATGAILTGGVSLLATGLSKKEDFTQMHCDNCWTKWLV